jgi:hypothetical protein
MKTDRHPELIQRCYHSTMSLSSAMSRAVVVALLLGAGAAAAAERFSGDAYSAAGNALLYRETQYLFAGGAERLVLYRCPDGRAFARKRVRESGNMQAPDFDLVDARLGYREGVRDRGVQREVYVQRRANLPEQADLLSVPADGVIDTGFDAFAQRHWDALLRGDTLRFPYLVPSRRTFYQFKVSRTDGGTPAHTMTIRLSASNWLSFLLPHIDVTFDLSRGASSITKACRISAATTARTTRCARTIRPSATGWKLRKPKSMRRWTRRWPRVVRQRTTRCPPADRRPCRKSRLRPRHATQIPDRASYFLNDRTLRQRWHDACLVLVRTSPLEDKST